MSALLDLAHAYPVSTAEDGQTNATWIEAVYQSSVRALVAMEWDGVKLGQSSCPELPLPPC